MKNILLPVFFTILLMAFKLSTKGQGGVLPLNGSVNGTLTSSIPDTWDLTTDADGMIRLSFTTVSPADLYITLFDNDGITVVGSAVESFNNSTVTLNVDGLAPGTYHAKVTAFGVSFGSYTLSDQLFTTTLNNDAEPNGSAAAASVLPVNGNMEGHVGYYYNNLRDTADWYKVSTGADGLLRVYLGTARGGVNSTNTLDVNMTLYDNDGITQLGAVEVYNSGGPATNLITADGLEAGTYYIKIEPFSTAEFANYTIADSLFTTPSNDIEPNGNRANAITLAMNDSSRGHVGYYYNQQRDTTDWYKVTTTADGLLRVYLSTRRNSIYSGNTLDVDVTLYDNDGTTQLGFVEVFNGNGPGTNLVTADGLEAGTYYIKVQPYSTTEFADYTISDSLFTTSSNDVEPNGNRANAIVLALNDSSRGHVGYYYNQQRDTADWYKLTTTADGLLRVYLGTRRNSVYSGNPLDVNVTLYDNDGTTQLGSVEVFNGNGPATNLITADGLGAGTYYIKVQPYSTGEFADYTISDSLFTTSSNDIEPNGNRSNAISLAVNDSSRGHVGYYYNQQKDTADWYKLTTTADGLLRVYLGTRRNSVYSGNTLDVNVTLYDNDGITQLGFVEVFNSNGPATNLITADGLAPGTYYIKVQPFSTGEFADYTISDSLFLPTVPNDNEPNGNTANAPDFPLDSYNAGHVGYYYNNQRDTTDWYRVTLSANSPLYIYLSTLRGSIYSTNTLDMNLTLFGSDGTTQLGNVEVFNANGPGTNNLGFASLAAGIYYIRVANFSTSEFGDYTLSVAGTNINLPVTYLHFDGVIKDNSSLLTWSTATESNNKGFEVQRSVDGQTYTAIGFVAGSGTSVIENKYDFTDTKPAGGYNYYRLKQVDLDGHFNYSAVIRLNFKKFNWSIAGNPVSANSSIQWQLTKSTNIALMVFTSEGKLIRTINKGILAEGSYTIPLPLENVSPGMYIIKLIADGEAFSKQVIKQ